MNDRAADPLLLRLADRAGLLVDWTDAAGRPQHVEDDVLRTVLQTMGLACGSHSQAEESLQALQEETAAGEDTLIVVRRGAPFMLDGNGPADYEILLENGGRIHGSATARAGGREAEPVLQTGYHQLVWGNRRLRLAVAPERAPSVEDVCGIGGAVRPWGVGAQLYSLRAGEGPRAGRENGGPSHLAAALLRDAAGAGSYADLAALSQPAAGAGASAIAISPVHALFAADPSRFSPYAPSSRLFLNVSYIDPAQALGSQALHRAAQALGEGGRLEARNPSDADLIDWPRVAGARLQLCRQLHRQFLKDAPIGRREAFERFRREGGEALESHARYEALHAHFAAELGVDKGWQEWPAAFRDPASAAVREYADSHAEAVEFHVFLQWLASEGLAHAQSAARNAGMGIGLISDLAIGTDPRGSHAWSRQADILSGVSAGAPPDLYQAAGQNWGLTAFSPRSLRQGGYTAFLETVRAALRHAGGVRIDHILGMRRMWLVPQGARAKDGAYLRYPLDDMLALLALEASRARAVVVGENLGTVPAGFNDKLAERGILGMSVLWFERGESDSAAPFLPPSQWPRATMSMPSTHDLPTIAGWWTGRDITWRKTLGQLDDEALQDAHDVRSQDKQALWRALGDAGLVADAEHPPAETPREAVLAFVSKTDTPLTMVSLEDLLGLEEQPNLPGTTNDTQPRHPNWQRRLPVPVDSLFQTAPAAAAMAAIIEARTRP